MDCQRFCLVVMRGFSDSGGRLNRRSESQARAARLCALRVIGGCGAGCWVSRPRKPISRGGSSARLSGLSSNTPVAVVRWGRAAEDALVRARRPASAGLVDLPGLSDWETVLLVDADPWGSARDWHEANGGEVLDVVGLDRETLAQDLKVVGTYSTGHTSDKVGSALVGLWHRLRWRLIFSLGFVLNQHFSQFRSGRKTKHGRVERRPNRPSTYSRQLVLGAFYRQVRQQKGKKCPLRKRNSVLTVPRQLKKMQ